MGADGGVKNALTDVELEVANAERIVVTGVGVLARTEKEIETEAGHVRHAMRAGVRRGIGGLESGKD